MVLGYFFPKTKARNEVSVNGLECHSGGLGKNKNVLELSSDLGWFMAASKIAGKIMTL